LAASQCSPRSAAASVSRRQARTPTPAGLLLEIGIRQRRQYNASEPVNDRKRWLDQFVHLMGHTGNCSREETIAEIDKERTLLERAEFRSLEACEVSERPRLH
jgi:hypothetical protein